MGMMGGPMAKDSKSSTGKPTTAKAPKDLAKPGKKGSIELTEGELNKVSGGLKLDYKE